METKTIINGQEVTITLTKEQLKEIAKQTCKKLSVGDINNIDDAEKVLENCPSHIKFIVTEFTRTKDWVTYQIETIIKAANFIDNGYKEYIPNFDDKSIYKYIPWLEKKSSGWVFIYVYDCYVVVSGCPVALYFKERNTAELICKKHITLYNQYCQG